MLWQFFVKISFNHVKFIISKHETNLMRKLTLLILLFIFHNVFAQQSLEFNIQGLKREAILYKPTKSSKNTPVVFVFHGHGGNAKFAARKMNFQDFYKEAVVVFMEGIP